MTTAKERETLWRQRYENWTSVSVAADSAMVLLDLNDGTANLNWKMDVIWWRCGGGEMYKAGCREKGRGSMWERE